MDIDTPMYMDDPVMDTMMMTEPEPQNFDLGVYLAAADDSSLAAMDVFGEAEPFPSWNAANTGSDHKIAQSWEPWCPSSTHDGLSSEVSDQDLSQDGLSPPLMPLIEQSPEAAAEVRQSEVGRTTRRSTMKPFVQPSTMHSQYFNPTTEDVKPNIHQLDAAQRSARESNLRQFAMQPDDPVPECLDDLSDNQLAMIDFKILMQLMDKAGLTSQQISEVKSRRRRLKNRLSARVCSNKKREKCSELEDTNRGLRSSIRHLSLENQKLKEDVLNLQKANKSLTKSSFDSAREAAALRAQVNHLTQLLTEAGLLGAAEQADDAAFAA